MITAISKLRINQLISLKSFIRSKSYYETLNNPKFTISMQPNLSELKCNESLYTIPKLNDSSRPKYILHDGPPYANGKPHVGHALNKVLKDITVRFKLLEGYDVEFKPGWDCHGLPIELKAVKSPNSNLSIKDRRSKARSVALKYMDIQKERFQNWAVLGDWDNAYKTIDNDYQANEMVAFSKLYDKGVIIRDKYPVYWSPSTMTALAEAELEYNENHQSKSVFLNFIITHPNTHLNEIISRNGSSMNLVIWTTTPWTLLANEAVAANPSLVYSICQADSKSDLWICAAEFIPKLESLLGKQLTSIRNITGDQLLGCEYKHPLLNKQCPVLNADYVTVEKGSGLVHVAPCHGKDDFYLGLDNQLPMNVLVNEEARYTHEAGPELHGLFTLTEGNDKVLSLLSNDILKVEMITHSYPYDWRSKQPVIIRLSEQWFIDTDQLKQEAELACQDVIVYPANMKARLINFAINRPRWCISRQRVWGVPIPVLYHKGAPIVDRDFISSISERVRREGPDFWWQESVESIVPKSLCDRLGLEANQITRGEDIFDIWFDSGLSWRNVLPESKVADLYLEGEDQFRGWFSSSLLLGVALTGRSPFKCIVSHGFTTDESGHKMSKSLGNVVDPDEVIRDYGVDVLRYWAATSGLNNSSIGQVVLQHYFSKYKAMRNMFRFILGNLWDFCPPKELSHSPNLSPIDQYILHEVLAFKLACLQLYSEFQYDQIIPSFERMNSLISNFYFTAVKDRLYCDNGESRAAAQSTLYALLCNATVSISPILPVLTQEIHQHWPTAGDEPLLHHFSWNHESIQLELQSSQSIKLAVERVALPIRDAIISSEKIIQLLSQEKKAANPFAAFSIDILPKSGDVESSLKLLQSDVSSSFSSLCEILRCAKVTLHPQGTKHFSEQTDNYSVVLDDLPSAEISISRLDKSCHCARCRRYLRVESDGEVCARCDSVITNKLDAQRKIY